MVVLDPPGPASFEGTVHRSEHAEAGDRDREG
jgi:hypothetical protein